MWVGTTEHLFIIALIFLAANVFFLTESANGLFISLVVYGIPDVQRAHNNDSPGGSNVSIRQFW